MAKPYELLILEFKVGFKTNLLDWWLAYYHLAQNHESLRVKLEKPVQCKGQQKPI
jgi:hypothetical protein